MNVKYVHKVPLITGFCYSESLFVCLIFVFVFLGKICEKCQFQHKRWILEIFSVIRKVNRDFHLWNKILYEDFGNRSEFRQVCQRTTTLGGATTTRGGETQIKSPFYFPMFIFISMFIFMFIVYIYIYFWLYVYLF